MSTTTANTIISVSSRPKALSKWLSSTSAFVSSKVQSMKKNMKNSSKKQRMTTVEGFGLNSSLTLSSSSSTNSGHRSHPASTSDNIISTIKPQKKKSVSFDLNRNQIREIHVCDAVMTNDIMNIDTVCDGAEDEDDDDDIVEAQVREACYYTSDQLVTFKRENACWVRNVCQADNVEAERHVQLQVQRRLRQMQLMYPPQYDITDLESTPCTYREAVEQIFAYCCADVSVKDTTTNLTEQQKQQQQHQHLAQLQDVLAGYYTSQPHLRCGLDCRIVPALDDDRHECRNHLYNIVSSCTEQSQYENDIAMAMYASSIHLSMIPTSSSFSSFSTSPPSLRSSAKNKTVAAVTSSVAAAATTTSTTVMDKMFQSLQLAQEHRLRQQLQAETAPYQRLAHCFALAMATSIELDEYEDVIITSTTTMIATAASITV